MAKEQKRSGESATALDDIIELVTGDILGRFPLASYTINILLWDDNTSSVECRHCDNEMMLHISKYYNNELTYVKFKIRKDDLMMIDEFGYRYIRELKLD